MDNVQELNTCGRGGGCASAADDMWAIEEPMIEEDWDAVDIYLTKGEHHAAK